MSVPKIATVLFFIYITSVGCSVLPAAFTPAVSISYRRIAPPSIIPFAASVSTFTKGLNIYSAPYAAGIASVPYYTSSLIPTNGVLPVSYGAYGPALIPASASGVISPNPGVATPNGILPSPLLPPSFRVPQGYVPTPSGIQGAFGSSNVLPGVISPSSLLPAPFGLQGRSINAVAPAVPISSAVIG